MNKLRSVLKKRRAKEDPRVRRRLFSWRMFAMTLLVVSVLSAGNVFALEKLLKMQVFSVVASMGWRQSCCICIPAAGLIGRCARSAARCGR